MLIIVIEIICVIIMIFIVLGVHELGHLLTGLKQGFRFEMFVVGPLGIKRENGKVKVYLNKNLAHYGGLAATLPKEDQPENINKFALICLAGPIASILLAALLGILYFSVDLPSSHIVLMGALTSFGIFLATTIPSKTGMFFTDRKRYQRLTTNGPEREVEIALLRILGNYSKDDSYINVNEKDIDTLVADEHYQFFGLFTKLTYQFEKEGKFDPNTKIQYDQLSATMPKAMVKATNMELQKILLKDR